MSERVKRIKKRNNRKSQQKAMDRLKRWGNVKGQLSLFD